VTVERMTMPSVFDVRQEARGAALALENERLRAAVEAQLDELRSSRQRIVEACLVERRRVERDLHDGAQQRLVTLALAVRIAREQAAVDADPQVCVTLDMIGRELQAALGELRELARGIHPALLVEAGLGPALESLAERSAIPAKVVSAPGRRFPPAVEATAYFVASEALANVAKYSFASVASINARTAGCVLVVEVADNGVGGANASRGSGITGLADRVAALAGVFEVDSPPGRGTRLTARIPYAA
jgi:signal transduction histidine kinase